MSAPRGVPTPAAADNSPRADVLLATSLATSPTELSAVRGVPTRSRADNSPRDEATAGSVADSSALRDVLPPFRADNSRGAAGATPATTHAATSSARAYAEQPDLTRALTRFGRGADGVRTLEVQLHPAELGAVHVRVALHNGRLDVTVACADPAARDAVTAALPSLHRDLAHLGTLEVTSGTAQQHDAADERPRGDQQRDDHPDPLPRRESRPDADFSTHLTGSER